MPKTPTRVATEIINRYRYIRALHTCYYTQVEHAVTEFSNEFFFLVGDIIEGKHIDESQLRFINLDRVRAFLEEEK